MECVLVIFLKFSFIWTIQTIDPIWFACVFPCHEQQQKMCVCLLFSLSFISFCGYVCGMFCFVGVTAIFIMTVIVSSHTYHSNIVNFRYTSYENIDTYHRWSIYCFRNCLCVCVFFHYLCSFCIHSFIWGFIVCFQHVYNICAQNSQNKQSQFIKWYGKSPKLTHFACFDWFLSLCYFFLLFFATLRKCKK